MATRDEAEELLRTLFADPAAARERALDELVADPDPAVSSIGHQIVAIVQRDVGATDDAFAHLRTALRLAGRADPGRAADVRATLGLSLVHAGRTRDGLAHLDRAAEELSGVPLARVLVRRAKVLGYQLEKFEAGAEDLRRALEILGGSGDDVWRARALNLQGLTRTGLGDLDGARRAFSESLEIYTALGFPWDAAVGVHNQGWVAFLEGDLPRALERYAEASDRLDAIGVTSVELVYDQCSAYLAGGLASDALEVLDRALGARPLLELERADLLLALAGAALAAKDLERARMAADGARRMFRRQGRQLHWVRAELLAVWTRAEAAERPARLLRRASALIDVAREVGSVELPQALLLGAQLGAQVRSARARSLTDGWLEEAAGFRHSRTSTTRALGWLALARRRERADDPNGVLRACDRGLMGIDEQQATLGSQELRALSSAHGAELAELGTRTALGTHDARRLLRWSERWRATALAASPPATREHDPGTAADLAALRVQHRRLADARAAGDATDRIEARAARLEQAVRRRLLHTRGTGAAAEALDVRVLLDALASDDTVLVELTEVDGHLHALVAGHGRVRRLDVGDAAAAAAAVDFALFALRGAARGRRSQLDLAGDRLQRALLGSALDHVGDSQVVVSGTSALQGVPWGLLPGLADRPVTSTPSARLWLRARQTSAEAERRVMLVGPGLASGGAEVPAVAAQDPSAEVLDGDGATVEASLAALDGAALAHVAAHGHFREDSPLFSSLVLADGPLLVHDLQRLQRPPHRVVLSACESGEMAPVGAQELLGLSAALLSMGTAGIVSSLGEVDDAATVEVMVALHAALREGRGLGEAMLAARRAAADDQVLAATAASFTVLGI
ncbi:putative Tetratricopeptide TPR_4 [metagenome]|uniref:Putative Tetratricopeptide TPR_4 n=1 Tax=metagenome TaxID=256318 RepID=A0A2P2CDB0_9ZZZZ